MNVQTKRVCKIIHTQMYMYIWTRLRKIIHMYISICIYIDMQYRLNICARLQIHLHIHMQIYGYID